MQFKYFPTKMKFLNQDICVKASSRLFTCCDYIFLQFDSIYSDLHIHSLLMKVNVNLIYNYDVNTTRMQTYREKAGMKLIDPCQVSLHYNFCSEWDLLYTTQLRFN